MLMFKISLQRCDSTCSFCAREWFAWWKARARANEKTYGRSGPGVFAEAQTASRERFHGRLGAFVILRPKGGGVDDA